MLAKEQELLCDDEYEKLQEENLKLKEEYEKVKEYNKYLLREIKFLEQELKIQRTINESLKKCEQKKK